MQLPASKPVRIPVAGPGSPFVVRYVDAVDAGNLLNQAETTLGVVGFGAGRPDVLSPSCPFIAAPLEPAAGDAIFEIWSAATPCRPVTVGPVRGACNGDLAFGAVTIDEVGNASFEAAIAAAYVSIFDFLEATGFAAPIRFWNYLTAITEDDRGLERYRRFNIGRHQAFTARLRQPLPPAASCVGGKQGASVIYFLAAHESSRAVENQRQISAYRYPPIYGPRSPSFSRASIHRLGESETLFVSGTASIVGHTSRHAGDLNGQIAETIENLRTVVRAAEGAASGPLGDLWAFKIYLRESGHRDMVDQAIDAAFGPIGQCLYLRGDICRPELLVEIEVLRHFALGSKAE